MRVLKILILIGLFVAPVFSAVGGEPAHIEIKIESDTVPANGISKIKLEAVVTDENGAPAPDGTIVTFTSDNAEIVSPDIYPDDPGVQTATREGVVKAVIGPSLKAGHAKVSARVGNQVAEVSIRFVPPAKSFTLVGIASGKLASMKSSNITPSGREEFDEGLQHDEKISLFLKTELDQGYLLTGAYDSSRRMTDRLFRELEPEKLYPIYGDSSSIFFEAVSSAKGYLKLERDLSYAMIGDFTTDMNRVEFGAYDRSLTGAKLNLDEENVRLIGFASRTDRKIIRDEIPGAGTSGYYTLTKFPIVRFSDRVRIEVRDRLRPERVLSSERKYRFVDYDIDYEDGTILFKQPVPRYDAGLNDVVIVVIYEAATGEARELVGGGYGELSWSDPQTQFSASLGGTYVRELNDFSDFHLGGANGILTLNDVADITGEVAWSQAYDEDLFKDVQGNAWKLEMRSQPVPGLSLEGYYRFIDKNFRNPVSLQGEIGSTKYGGSATYNSSVYGTITLEHSNSEYDQTPDLVTYTGAYARLMFSSLSYRNQINQYSFRVGVEDTVAETDKNETTESLIGMAELGVRINPKLSASVLREQNLLSDGARFMATEGGYNKLPGTTFQGIRSNATTLGLDYAFSPRISIYARGRVPDDVETLDDVVSIVGVRSQPAKGLSAYSEYRIGGGIGGAGGVATVGLRNRIKVRPDLALNLSVERVRAIDNISAIGGDFDAVSAALEYLPDMPLKGTVKYEARKDDFSVWNMAQVAGSLKVEDGISLIARHRYSNRRQRNTPGTPSDTRNHTVAGVAVRPEKFNYINILAKIEYKMEDNNTVDPATDYDTLIASVEGVLHPVRPLEIYSKYAVRYSTRREMNFEHSSTADLWIARTRIELNRYIDVGGEYRVIFEREIRNFEHGIAGELGFWFIKNLRAAVGYNFLGGSKDKDFPESEYWTKGPYFRLMFKQ